MKLAENKLRTAPSPSREELLASIAEEEARLAKLDADQASARGRLAGLRAELATLSTEPEIRARLPLVVDVPAPTSPAEKVALFRSLFRGRQDVFPTRFVSKKTGKPGYAPACRNKFVKGICELPRVKCGECPNQAFIPFDDAAVVGHLTGHYVMGVYPLLEDETCWLLAVDFDKSTWTDDVRAFAETCRRGGLPAAVERSRSGNGAHVWLFFSAPVPAASARKMGCYLITETMSRRHELSMDSYDRLFPSQDTMPRGGFGNLIALPLQQGPRKDGNSVFLDEALQPLADDQQWAYLASVPRIDPATVGMIARDATRQGSVVGVRMAETADEEDATPWSRLPSRMPKPIAITEPLPPTVRAVLAQKLFVEKAGLPSPLLDQIKRLAAFQNPEFYKKQAMRLSTAMTPRVIACAEDLPQFVGLPRGRRSEVDDLLRGYGVSLKVEDDRLSGEPLGVRFQGRLTPVQEKAAGAMLEHDIGVFVAPPGVGKTVVGTYLVAKRGCSTLILVHRRPLLDQWLAQLSLFLGIEPKEIGQIGGGKRSENGKLDVAMIQSLVRKEKVADIVANYGQVVVDECHHLPAVSFERVLAEAKARYVVGLTATPQRRDGHHPITEMQLGPVRFAVDPKSQAARRPFAHKLIVRETGFKLRGEDTPSIQELYAALASDEKRNRLILDDVIRALEEGRSPILLIGERPEVVVALDWTDFDQDNQSTIALYLVTKHGRATPLLWKSVMKSELKDWRNEHEDALLERFKEVVPATTKVTVLAGRGFGDHKLYELLKDQLGFDFIIRFRGVIKVTDARGETRAAKDWVPDNGRPRMIKRARVTQTQREVAAVVCVHAKGMAEPWHLATSREDKTGADIVTLYGKRFTIEETFRDLKNLRFGMGLTDTRISSPERRDRILLVGAIAASLLTLLGAAGESLGLDMKMKANTVKTRTHSLLNQGLFYFDCLLNMREERARPLMLRFDELLRQHAATREIFGLI